MLAFGIAGIKGSVLRVRVYVRVLEALLIYPLVLPFGLCVRACTCACGCGCARPFVYFVLQGCMHVYMGL